MAVAPEECDLAVVGGGILGLAVARERGLLTVALAGGGGGRLEADHVLVTASTDPLVVKEVHVTTYHLLWELTHVFLEGAA